MAVRAVITVGDDSGRQRRFYGHAASSPFQILGMAEFIGWIDAASRPMTIDTYLEYARTHPHTLPAEDITERGWYADEDEVGDLDHRYRLTLSDRDRGFRFVIRDRRRDQPPTGAGRLRCGFTPVADIRNRAGLYGAAAHTCDRMAALVQRYMDRNNGHPMPGYPPPHRWRAHAAAIRNRQHAAAGATAGVAQLSAAERGHLAARITRLLHRHHPGVAFRTSTGTDGIITLIAPSRFACEREAHLIAEMLAGMLGRRYTVHIRRHRPSRTGSRVAVDGSRTGVRATLTFRPTVDAGPDPTPAGTR